MNESMIQGQIIRPFSPAIGKYKLSDDTITTLNNHCLLYTSDAADE